LMNPLAHEDLTEAEVWRLVKYALQFFLLDGKLMRGDIQGWHKVVLPEHHQLDILQQVHDQLGHKGIFTMVINLKDRFWWPMLEDNVKWFILTCHTCQT